MSTDIPRHTSFRLTSLIGLLFVCFFLLPRYSCISRDGYVPLWRFRCGDGRLFRTTANNFGLTVSPANRRFCTRLTWHPIEELCRLVSHLLTLHNQIGTSKIRYNPDQKLDLAHHNHHLFVQTFIEKGKLSIQIGPLRGNTCKI